ncbi:MAG: imidazole glycerol phosphate synthase cyclase subunit [Candidatus Omnitrophica bacterium]|nr:imidazole glycerol phosphate synthase cyclase subunit [Candidatus Omnitrophota bacterium]
MLKKRIIACLTVKNGLVVQSIGFKQYLPVGRVAIAVEFLSQWAIDEIVLLDIDASREGRRPDFDMIKNASRRNSVPLTVGGGIRTIDDIMRLIHSGADKVSLNTVFFDNPDFIKEASRVFGVQCIVVSGDAGKNKKGRYEIYSRSGLNPAGLDPAAWARKAEELGAGEIFINSIERDGSKAGFDIPLIREVSKTVSIPVIACGGAGHPKHFYEALTAGGVSAVCAGNYFHFTEHSPITTKAYLVRHGLKDIRLDSYANYKEAAFTEAGRIAKMGEDYLADLMFEFLPEEVI